MERFTLSAKERIKNSNEITTLIRQGQAFFLAPFKVYYTWGDTSINHPIRVAFAVPKKKFSKAVQRNKLKRLSREAFRLQRHLLNDLVEKKESGLNILFLYQKTKAFSSKEIYQSVGDSLQEIINKDG